VIRCYANRGNIVWFDLVKGLGRARVYVPKGIYTHSVFCSAPRDAVMGVNQLAHPLVLDRAGFVDVDPIQNADAPGG
jgi:hypothetical protein